MRGLTAASLALWATAASAAPEQDRVSELPLYGEPKTRHYSGFLDADQGTRLHYWFVESSHINAADQPVVLWLNGGPGSSSILGMLQEHGPLMINATGNGLFENPYAWNTLANVFVMESPGGVGYSYCPEMVSGGSCHNTDKSTAINNRKAVQSFFRKFPEYKDNKFYITGESYAGVYIPTLTRELIDNAPDVTVTGIAVGDPCTDNDSQRDSMDMLWYGHKYGFVPDADFDLLWNHCGARFPSDLKQGEWKGRAAQRLLAKTEYTGKNSPECRAAHRRFLMTTSNGFSQDWPLAFINDLSLYGYAALVSSDEVGSLNYFTAQYMMRDDVREALHVTEAPQTTWPGPHRGWTYKSDYAACNDEAKPGTPSMIDFYRYIAPRINTTIVFNGDTDPCVSYEGTRTALERVNFSEVEGGSFRPWFFEAGPSSVELLKQKPTLFGPDLTLQDAGVQLGGNIVDYEHNLHFMTVHGSGHMAPTFRPRSALHMLDALLSGKALSPSMPLNLGNMTDTEFDHAYDAWVQTAQLAPYV